jgi:hypothetical protein
MLLCFTCKRVLSTSELLDVFNEAAASLNRYDIAELFEKITPIDYCCKIVLMDKYVTEIQ